MNQTLLYILFTFINKSISLITLPIFTRIMNSEEFGEYSLYSSFLGIITILFGLNLQKSLIIGKIDFQNDFYELVKSNKIVMNFIFIFFLLLAIIFGDYIQFFMKLESKIIFYILIIHSFFESIFIFNLQEYIALKDPKNHNKNILIKNICSVFFSITSMFIFKNKVLGRIIGNIIIVIFLVLIKEYKNIGIYLNCFKIKIKYVKYSLAVSLPLLFHSLSTLILNQSDRIIISRTMDISQVGLYHFSYQISLLLTMIWFGHQKSLIPWIYEKIRDNQEELIRIKIKKILKIYTCILLLILLTKKELILILGGEQFLQGSKVISIVLIGAILNIYYTITSLKQFYLKKTYYVPIITLFASLINVILNIKLIPKYGYIAAATTTVFSYFIMFILNHFISEKYLKKQKIYALKDIFLQLMLVIFLVFTLEYISLQIYMRYFLVLILIYYIFKISEQKFRENLNSFKKKREVIFDEIKED